MRERYRRERYRGKEIEAGGRERDRRERNRDRRERDGERNRDRRERKINRERKGETSDYCFFFLLDMFLVYSCDSHVIYLFILNLSLMLGLLTFYSVET